MYLYYVDKQLQWYYAMTELYIIKAAFHMEYNNIFGVIWIKFQQKRHVTESYYWQRLYVNIRLSNIFIFLLQ